MKVIHCFESSTQHMIRYDRLRYDCPSLGEHGLVDTQVWEAEDDIKEKMFDKEASMTPMMLLYVDVPYLFSNTELG